MVCGQLRLRVSNGLLDSPQELRFGQTDERGLISTKVGDAEQVVTWIARQDPPTLPNYVPATISMVSPSGRH
jgi:hypothetical protein